MFDNHDRVSILTFNFFLLKTRLIHSGSTGKLYECRSEVRVSLVFTDLTEISYLILCQNLNIYMFWLREILDWVIPVTIEHDRVVTFFKFAFP